MSDTARNWRVDLALFLTVVAWGVNFPVLKAVLDVLPVHGVNAIRMCIATAVLGVLFAWKSRRRGYALLTPMRLHPWGIIGIGLLGYVAYQLAFITGVARTTAGSAALIMASPPLWTAIFGRVLRIETLRPLAWVGLVLSLVGTVAVVLTGGQAVSLGSETLLGNLLIVAAALLWSLYTILSKPLLRDVPPLGLTFYGLLVGTPILIAIAIPDLASIDWTTLTPWLWGAIVFSGGVSIGLAVAAWAFAVNAVGAAQTAVWSNVVPVVALLLGYVWLDEAVTFGQLGGGALVLAGLYLVRRARLAGMRAQTA